MTETLIVAAISGIVGTLSTRLRSELPSGVRAPSKSDLSTALQKLISQGSLVFQNDEQLFQLLTPEVAKMLLSTAVMTKDNEEGQVSAKAIKRLIDVCLGSTTGTGAGPKNRKTIAPKSGGHHYVYFIDALTIPNIGINAEEFRQIFASAWDLWFEHAPRLKVRALKKAEHKNRANMHVQFTGLGGSGKDLAIATLRKKNTKSFKMDLNIDKPWTPSKLLHTAMHELGHIIGIDHIATRGAVMYESQPAGIAQKPFDSLNFTQADIDAIPAMWK